MAPIFVQLFWFIAHIFKRQLQLSNCSAVFVKAFSRRLWLLWMIIGYSVLAQEKKNNHWSTL